MRRQIIQRHRPPLRRRSRSRLLLTLGGKLPRLHLMPRRNHHELSPWLLLNAAMIRMIMTEGTINHDHELALPSRIPDRVTGDL